MAEGNVTGENAIGLLAITNAPATAIIGVPWVSLSGGGEISVSNLVHTANLTNGDKLKVIDDNGTLQAWTLADGVWNPDYIAGDKELGMSDGADTVTLARGRGVWLTRQNPSAPIYLVGQVCTNKVETALEVPGEEGAAAWTLVAAPFAGSVDVADVAKDIMDEIRVLTAGAPKTFTANKVGVWGYTEYYTDDKGLVRSRRVTGDTQIPAGTGFWYINKSTTPGKKIEW